MRCCDCVYVQLQYSISSFKSPHKQHEPGHLQVVVFLSTCAGVDFHHALLAGVLPPAVGARPPGKLFKLHGNLAQVRFASAVGRGRSLLKLLECFRCHPCSETCGMLMSSHAASWQLLHGNDPAARQPCSDTCPLLGTARKVESKVGIFAHVVQAERTATFLDFTKSKSGVLLCTDVAARGLDFSAVSSIVQYDPPGEASE